MTSDSGMEEEQSTMGEEETQMGEMQGSMKAPQEEAMTAEAPAEAAAPSKKKVGGRRAALKIVRENVERVGSDLSNFRKSSEASAKRLEKQLGQLRSDISALKSHVAKEASRAREKQESLSNKILARMVQKPKKTPRKASSSKKRKSKGKK